MIRNKRKFSIGQLILNILLVAFLVGVHLPASVDGFLVAEGVRRSCSPANIYLIPKQFTLEHYREVLHFI